MHLHRDVQVQRPYGFASVLMNHNRSTTLEKYPTANSELSHQKGRWVGQHSARVRQGTQHSDGWTCASHHVRQSTEAMVGGLYVWGFATGPQGQPQELAHVPSF